MRFTNLWENINLTEKKVAEFKRVTRMRIEVHSKNLNKPTNAALNTQIRMSNAQQQKVYQVSRMRGNLNYCTDNNFKQTNI